MSGQNWWPSGWRHTTTPQLVQPECITRGVLLHKIRRTKSIRFRSVGLRRLEPTSDHLEPERSFDRRAAGFIEAFGMFNRDFHFPGDEIGLKIRIDDERIPIRL